ncbi:MAG: adenylate/guanylate cyclase domain-containing protein [Acidimicrobiia bacterium]
MANRVIRVNPAEVAAILGRLTDPDDGVLESATRTFVFTDLVDSTILFDTLGDQVTFEIVRDHDRLVRDLLEGHSGREVKHTGDGFMLAFTFPADALSFSIALQHGLADGRISARIGVNTGTPVAEGGDFFGMAVTIAARLCQLASGGEILTSEEVVGGAQETGFTFTEVGPVQLKGRASAILVYRLEVGPKLVEG